MPADREPTRLDPIVTGMADAGVHGYRALESVGEGLREMLRARAGRGPDATRRAAGRAPGRAPAAGAGRTPVRPPVDGATGRRPLREPLAATRRPGRGGAAAGEVLGDLADVLAELLELAGEVAHDVADAISSGPDGRDDDGDGGGAPEGPEQVTLHTVAGEMVVTEFTVWNTGSVVLRDMEFTSTALVGPRAELPGERVSFSPEAVPLVPPGTSATVELRVPIPADAEPGTYRGLVQADPGGAFVVVSITVAAAA
jgi:hypothetical protein